MGANLSMLIEQICSRKLEEISPITSFPPSQVLAAFSAMQSRESIGKMIIKPESGGFFKVCCLSRVLFLSSSHETISLSDLTFWPFKIITYNLYRQPIGPHLCQIFGKTQATLSLAVKVA